MISSVLALVAAAAAAQASDTTRTAREAFTACLRTFVDRSVDANKSAADFEAEYSSQCSAQEAAFRDAIVRRDVAMRSTRATAEDSARMEIEDARANFSERFAAAMPAQPAPQPTPQSAAQPAPQPASQPTPQ